MRAHRLRTTGTLLVAVALTCGVAASASAVFQQTSPASCSTEVRVASKTTGETLHMSSANQFWNKGYKNNAGATSYTGYKSLASVSTQAPTISSSGFGCR